MQVCRNLTFYRAYSSRKSSNLIFSPVAKPSSPVAILATIQTFTSHGTVFWIFDMPYTDYVMGPFLSRNH